MNYRLILSAVCDIVIFLSIALAAYSWHTNHDDIMTWLYHLLSGAVFAILSLRYDKDE